MSQSDCATQIITNIINYSERHGDLLGKYSLDFYLQYFDRQKLINLASRLPPHQALTKTDFIRTMLLHIDHPQEHTLYLALSVSRLFTAVLERGSISSATIEFSDLTNYLCEVFFRVI